MIDALPLRYAYPATDKPDPHVVMKDLKEYSEALGRKWDEFRYNADFGALYAESLIEMHPWDLYDKDHQPTSPDTDKILNVLTSSTPPGERPCALRQAARARKTRAVRRDRAGQETVLLGMDVLRLHHERR